MAEIFSTVGLVTDVLAVLILILLAHIEAAMPAYLGDRQSPLGYFKTRMGHLRRNYPCLFWVNCGCVLALFVGTGSMIVGIWK